MMASAFQDNHKYNDTTCEQQILGSDREEIVFKLMQEAISIWKSSQCNKCYQPSSQLPVNEISLRAVSSDIGAILSKDTQEFANLTQQTLTCFSNEEVSSLFLLI